MDNAIIQKLSDYQRLTKFKVDIVVALTAVFGYLFSGKTIDIKTITFLFIGGLLVTATAHIINQIIEKDLDRKMNRTSNRPLVNGKISQTELIISVIVFSFTGIFLLYLVHPFSAYISFVSLIMYSLLYTPLKQIHRISIYVGAIPGALPILIGYVAATGSIDKTAILLFVFQVLWQLPHFWSIAWLWHDDYTNAGYDLLPVKGGKSNRNALLTFLSSLLLFPVIYFLLVNHTINNNVFVTLLLLTSIFVFTGFLFYKKQNNISAKRLMLSSIIYLPIVQLIIILNQN